MKPSDIPASVPPGSASVPPGSASVPPGSASVQAERSPECTPGSRGLTQNPYSFGSPVRSPWAFYGREQQLLDTFEHVQKVECISLVGERRCGKTSFQLHICHPEVRARYQTAEEMDSTLFVYLNAETSPQDSAGFFGEVFRLARLEDPGFPDPSPVAGESSVVDERTVNETLRALVPTRLVLVIDEFESISTCESFPPRFFVFLRGLSISYGVSFVVATSKRLVDCCSHEVVSSPFPNIFCPVELGAFTEGEFRQFVRNTGSQSGVPIADLEADLLEMSGRFPYLAQLACWHAFQVWQECGEYTAGARAEVRRRFAAGADPFFGTLWRRYLDEEEQEALRLLARGHTANEHVVWGMTRKGYVLDGRIASEPFVEYVIERDDEIQGNAVLSSRVPLEGVFVDTDSGNAYIDGEIIDPPLPRYQFLLLKTLYESRGKICTPYMIVTGVWTEDYIDEVDDQRIAQLIRRLRKRIEPQGKPWRHIRTVRGRGLVLSDGKADGAKSA